MYTHAVPSFFPFNPIFSYLFSYLFQRAADLFGLYYYYYKHLWGHCFISASFLGYVDTDYKSVNSWSVRASITSLTELKRTDRWWFELWLMWSICQSCAVFDYSRWYLSSQTFHRLIAQNESCLGAASDASKLQVLSGFSPTCENTPRLDKRAGSKSRWTRSDGTFGNRVICFFD